MVPTENAALAGLRRVIDEETVKKVLAVLQDECSEMPKNWNRRFKHNRDKIKTGDIYELAEVVRNLAIRESEKGLSTGEKQMYTRAKKILASELMYALEMDEEEVEAHLYGLLVGVATATATATARWQWQRQGRPSPPSRRRNGGRADRGRGTWRAPWVGPAQGARHRCGQADARVERRRAAGGRGRRRDRRRAARRTRSTPAPAGTVAVAGGDVRSQSVREALRAAGEARPGDRPRRRPAARARPSCSSAALDELERSGADAVIAAAPVSDTIKEVARRRSDRGAHARPLPTVGRSDAAGVPARGARAGAVGGDDELLRGATDDAWLIEQAGGVVRVVPVRSREPQGHDRRRSAGRRAAAVGARW